MITADGAGQRYADDLQYPRTERRISLWHISLAYIPTRDIHKHMRYLTILSPNKKGTNRVNDPSHATAHLGRLTGFVC